MRELDKVLNKCIECGLCLDECDFLQKYCQFPKDLAVIFKENGFSNSPEIPYSCNICSLCQIRCPEGLDIGNMVLEIRGKMVEKGSGPLPQHAPISLAQQFYVSTDFKLTLPALNGKTRHIFFPGCSLSAYSPELVIKTYLYLTEKLPETGIILGCCGGPSYLMGDRDNYHSISLDLINEVEKLGATQIIVACPFCYNLLKKQDDNIEVVLLYNLLDDLGISVDFSEINTSNEDLIFNIHDPCTVRFQEDAHSAVRSLIEKSGFKIDEISHNQMESHCCGMGGMVYVVDEELGKLRSQRTLDEAVFKIVTYCASCRGTLQGRGGDVLHILDLIFNSKSQNNIIKPPNSPETSIENMKSLKNDLYKEYMGNSHKKY